MPRLPKTASEQAQASELWANSPPLEEVALPDVESSAGAIPELVAG